MPITELLEENARKYGNDVALVEVNPQVQETRRVLWKDYDLIQPTSSFWYRREITWHVFDEKANRFAQLLMSRGVKKGDKVAILLMNCLEWLPIYFGTLKTGALAVPMNFRYSAEEIEYCLDLAEADVLVFGPEFIGRIETIAESISKKRILFYVGGDCPSFAEDYDKLTSNCASISPGGRRCHLFLLRYDWFPESNSSQPRKPDARLQGRAESSSPDQGRCLSVYSAAVSHRCQDALVRQPAHRRTCSASERSQSGNHSGNYFP